jgi:hypothetical protein
MAHFAKVEDGVVTQVIVADSQQWCEANLGGTWVQTSYNTHGGVNNRVGGENLRKNYAGIGYEYHYDGIVGSMHHSRIHLGQRMQTLIYGNAPTPMPTDGKRYAWDEDSLSWVEVETP